MPFTSLPYSVDLLRLHAAHPARYPFLLQTLGGTPGWDVLCAFPEQKIVWHLGQPGAFLEQLDHAWRTEKNAHEGDGKASWLPFRGGWFVYLGYELLHEIESRVPSRAVQSNFPIGCATRVPAAILVDREHDTTYLYAEPAHATLLELIQRDITHAPPLATAPIAMASLEEEAPEQFLNGVARIQRYIRAGDVFQVNLARRWQGRLNGDAIGLYQALAHSNPAPFCGLAYLGDGAYIVSSSPERLVRVRHGMIETRPIAGTHPRSADPAQDIQLKAQLLSTAKERAEHIMLVDLERNDLGRICKPGSVTVPALLEVATYAHVHHLESTVRGELRDGVTPGETIHALFPGGTITGCPKVRCMQIIRELEAAPRLAYTGSMGYINHDGSLDLNILIRSFMLQDRHLQFWAGAGIVADSVPERELSETRAKAKGLLRALCLDSP
ncbi:MAG: aminodeoxychorismate synthase component I [Burkholderiales bacterium]